MGWKVTELDLWRCAIHTRGTYLAVDRNILAEPCDFTTIYYGRALKCYQVGLLSRGLAPCCFY